MEKILKLTNKSEFLKFLDAISKINDQGVILDIKNNKVSALVSSLDSTLILHTELTGINDLDSTLNIPDVKKLKHVLDTIENENVDIIINENNLQYNSSDIKFKYHLYEEGFITRPNINLDKINKFVYDVEFKLDKNTLQRIRLLSIINDEFTVRVNTEYGVVVFDIQSNDIKLKYIISALTQ